MNSLKLMELTSKLDDLLEKLEALDEDRLEDTFELDSLKDQAESLKSEADDLDFEAITLDVDGFDDDDYDDCDDDEYYDDFDDDDYDDDFDDDECSEELEDWVSRLEDLEWEVENLESDVDTFLLCLDMDCYNCPEEEKTPVETRRSTVQDIVRSEKTFFDGYYHYDASGQKVAESRVSFLGFNTFDMNGNKIGHSDKNALDGYNHYDASGTKIGYSIGGGPYLYTNYDASGNKIGHSRFDGSYVYQHSYIGGSSDSASESTEDCYVATCVHGSYDCPEARTGGVEMDRQKLQELRNTVATLLEQLEQMPEERFPDYKSYVSLKYRLKKLKGDGEWLAGEGDQLDEDPELTEEWKRLLEKMSRQVQEAETETKEMLASVKPLTTDQSQKAAEAFKEFDDFGSLYGLSRENYDSEEEYRVAVEYAEEVYMARRNRQRGRILLLAIAGVLVLFCFAAPKIVKGFKAEFAKRRIFNTGEKVEKVLETEFLMEFPEIDPDVSQSVEAEAEVLWVWGTGRNDYKGTENLKVVIHAGDIIDSWPVEDIYYYLQTAYSATEAIRGQLITQYAPQHDYMYLQERETFLPQGIYFYNSIEVVVETTNNTYVYSDDADSFQVNGILYPLGDPLLWEEIRFEGRIPNMPQVGMDKDQSRYSHLGAFTDHSVEWVKENGVVTDVLVICYWRDGDSEAEPYFTATISQKQGIVIAAERLDEAKIAEKLWGEEPEKKETAIPETPSVGMSEAKIDQTMLGKHRDCSYDGVWGDENTGDVLITYCWRDGTYYNRTYFTATVSQKRGTVIAVEDVIPSITAERIREWEKEHSAGVGSSSANSTGSSPSFGDSYSDPEEAYYWNTDDYFDYEDAEADFYD